MNRALWLATVASILSACVVVEDFQGYGPIDGESTCDRPICEGMGGAGGSSNTPSSSSGGLAPPVPSGSSGSSSSGTGGTSLASSSSASSSSSSSSGSSSGQMGSAGSVACNGTDCTVSQGTIGCCYIDAATMTCLSTVACMLRPIFYCDGREDCGGTTCCFSNGQATCTEACPSGTYVCLDHLDCPAGFKCQVNTYGEIGQCVQ